MQLAGIQRPSGQIRWRPDALAADKAYSIPWIRQWLREHKIKAVIPERSDQRENRRGRPPKFDKEAYRERNTVERCIGWIKEARSVATRYEKLAVNYLAMVHLAMLRRYFRVFK